MEGGRNAFKVLKDKTRGNTRLEVPRPRWEQNLERILKKQISIRGIGLIRLRIGIIGEPL